MKKYGYTQGTAVYKCINSMQSALYITGKLIKLNHCMFFLYETMYHTFMVEEDGVKFCVMHFDTESG